MNSTTVNRPTDVKRRNKDIENKLQLYAIGSAFREGKMPANDQCDVTLNSLLASHAFSNPSKRLSSEGHKLVTDVRDVIEQAKLLMLTKNDGELLQDFIWQTSHMSGVGVSGPKPTVDKATAQQHGNEALDGLRSLGTLILSNGQFRKLLKDATVLLRDVAGDAAQNAANRVNPSEDDLRQVDEPAADNTWHETPNLSRDNLKNQAKAKYNEQKPFSRSDVKQAGDGVAQTSRQGDSNQATGQANTAAHELRDKASANMPEETKQKGIRVKEQGHEYLNKKMPKERREQTLFRLKKMIVEIQSHPDYQRAIDTLLRLAREYSGHTKNMKDQSQGAVKGAHSDTRLQAAEADLKTLIERFANYTSLDDLFESINQIYRDADRDPELKGWFRSIDEFIRRCLKEQGFILQDSSTQEYHQLHERGQYLLRDKYKQHTDRILDEFKYIGHQFDEDAQNRAFANSLKKLFHDLGNDENGKPTFKPHLLKDLTEVIIPAAFEHTRYVPVPRIEYSDPMFDAAVENLVIESDNLTPNMFEFASDNFFRWGRKNLTSSHKNKVMASVSGVQMDLKDVSYYINRKQGFPSITDIGVFDLFLGGSGFSFKIDMETADKTDRMHFFKVNRVDVQISNLQIVLKQSKYKLLFKFVKPLLLKLVRPVIQKLAEKQIKNYVHQLDQMAYRVHEEVKRVEADAKRNPDPQNVQNIYQRYMQAANKTIMQGKQKSQEKASDKQVKVATTKHDSLFPNISLPGGVSTKATEYRNTAKSGDRWRSPIFGIGSAKPSSNLPKIGQVARKPHGTRGPASSGTNYTNGVGSGAASSGFHSQVNEAFGNTAQSDYRLGGAGAGATTGAVPASTGTTMAPTTATGTSTTLGSNNPVLTGAA